MGTPPKFGDIPNAPNVWNIYLHLGRLAGNDRKCR